ncbi:hypothetical protein C8Q73DRAFT_664268 [Cubamyces lactineus]|nr:hypothetical protein C8Q73DRAFT_664268 [Cubamyces lactineus]
MDTWLRTPPMAKKRDVSMHDRTSIAPARICVSRGISGLGEKYGCFGCTALFNPTMKRALREGCMPPDARGRSPYTRDMGNWKSSRDSFPLIPTKQVGNQLHMDQQLRSSTSSAMQRGVTSTSHGTSVMHDLDIAAKALRMHHRIMIKMASGSYHLFTLFDTSGDRNRAMSFCLQVEHDTALEPPQKFWQFATATDIPCTCRYRASISLKSGAKNENDMTSAIRYG